MAAVATLSGRDESDGSPDLIDKSCLTACFGGFTRRALTSLEASPLRKWVRCCFGTTQQMNPAANGALGPEQPCDPLHADSCWISKRPRLVPPEQNGAYYR